MYGKEQGFQVSGDPQSCTKTTELRISTMRNIAVHDTKGFFDNKEEFEQNYQTAKKDRKLQIINEIMSALESLRNSGINAILLVVKFGRMDIKDKEIIKELSNCLFEESVKKKVYIVFTSTPKIYTRNRQKATEWLVTQSKMDDSPIKDYFFMVEQDWNRVFFVNNLNPFEEADPEDENEVNEVKGKNVEMVSNILTTLRNNCQESVKLLSVYNKLCEEFSKLKEDDEKKGNTIMKCRIILM